jgi:hypothetical protein
MLRIGTLAAALFLTACASAGEDTTSAARDCFRSETATGFNVIDRTTIEVRAGASRRYRLTTSWPTNNLDFSQHVGLRSPTGYICTGNGLGVEVVGGEPRQTYPIESVARVLEPAEQG